MTMGQELQKVKAIINQREAGLPIETADMQELSRFVYGATNFVRPDPDRKRTLKLAEAIINPTLPLFGERAILDLRGIPVENLTHSFKPRFTPAGAEIDFTKVSELFRNSYEEIVARIGHFDRFNLGTRKEKVLDLFHSHPSYLAGLEMLGVKAENLDRAFRPWWNVVTALEVDCEKSDDRCHISLTSSHSQEVDLSGEAPGYNTSVVGLVITKPEESYPNGKIVLGIRGGYNYRNTFMLVAGSLQATPELLSGKQSIYRFFESTELKNELGIEHSQIAKAECLASFVDCSTKPWPHYTFQVQTNLYENDIKALWKNARDHGEHRSLIFLPNDPESIRKFIRKYYKGYCSNRSDRADNEKQLLHIPALALAHHAEISLDFLAALYRPDKD